MKAHLYPKKIWKQAAVVMCATAVLPMVLLGSLLLITSRKAVKTTVLRDQEQIVIRAASEINRFINRPKDLLRSTASILGTLHTDTWRQETALVELTLNEDIFSRLSSVDLEGVEIATSDLGSPLLDFSKDPTFVNARQGKVSLSSVYITEENVPHMRIGVPIQQYGQVSGVLIAEVSLRGFWKIVDDIKIGQSGEAYVVSETGLLIAHPDKKRVMLQENLSNDIVVQKVLNNHAGSLEYEDQDQKHWLKSYAPISLTNWGFIIKQSDKDVYSFLYVMYVQAIALIILTVLAAIFLCVFLAPRLVEPIRILSDRMASVANGQLGSPVPVNRLDEIGKLIASFNEMTKKLKEARDSEHLTTIGKAATAITHELKNSLLMADTYIQLLRERYKDREFVEQYLAIVPTEMENWKNMLNEISDFAQKKPLQMQPIKINDFLMKFIVFTQAKMNLHGIQLISDMPGQEFLVMAHEQKLRQVLVNLCLNALEAMPDGGELFITAGRNDKNVEIKIRDTGQGIPQDMLNKIFEPFYSSRPNKLGLGLSICQDIIGRQGGQLRAESIEGTGAAFFILLPILGEASPTNRLLRSSEMIK